MWNNRDSNVGRRGAAVSLLLLLAALLAACGAAPGAAVQQAETVEVIVGDLSANATASGALRAARAATLESSATARVTEVLVRAGQEVAAGEPLVVLDATDLELNGRAAQGNLRQAEAQLADLLREPTAAELSAAEAGVESAQAQLDDL
ncbi:MAG: biotin/lipoyl-binding protein, partial [Candidatus Promineofilum sp.]|nr:biotin/lipoyl-binding protein [Promineifilum sp.]